MAPFVSTSHRLNYISCANTRVKGRWAACHLVFTWSLPRCPSEARLGQHMGLVQGPPTPGRPWQPSWPGSARSFASDFSPRGVQSQSALWPCRFSNRGIEGQFDVINGLPPTMWRRREEDPASASRSSQSVERGKF